jgi:hypothetical protein
MGTANITGPEPDVSCWKVSMVMLVEPTKAVNTLFAVPAVVPCSAEKKNHLDVWPARLQSTTVPSR